MEYSEKVNSKGFVYWEHIETGEVTWENPYYDVSPADNHESVIELDEWVHYYDDEGHGYWYNESTGESEWSDPNIAEMDQENYTSSSDDDDEDDDEDSDSDSDSDTESGDADDDSDDDSYDSEDDDELEAKFQAMLDTPEGREALEAEKRAILEEEARRVRREFSAPERKSQLDINDDIEAGPRRINNSSKLSNRKRGERTSNSVQSNLEESPVRQSNGYESIREKWNIASSKCRAVSRRTKYWLTKTLQGMLLGAFSFAKYSLEYAEALTYEGNREPDESDEDEPISRAMPKPPKGPPPSRRPPLDIADHTPRPHSQYPPPPQAAHPIDFPPSPPTDTPTQISPLVGAEDRCSYTPLGE